MPTVEPSVEIRPCGTSNLIEREAQRVRQIRRRDAVLVCEASIQWRSSVQLPF
jgi:hypothetical protein